MTNLKSQIRNPKARTRNTPWWAPALLLAAALGQVTTPFAADYATDWWTVAGGGGTSTGSVFTATGTIGQPAAATATGGQFAVQAGFWGILAAVQTTNAPVLNITISTTNSVIISWPAPSTGWQLQHTPSLRPASWSDAGTPQPVGGHMQVIASPPVGNRFYRLTR